MHVETDIAKTDHQLFDPIGPQLDKGLGIDVSVSDLNTDIPKLDELHQKTPEDKAEKDSKSEATGLKKFMKDHLPLGGAYVTAIGHTIAASGFVFGFNSKEFIDKISLNASKLYMSANCAFQAYEALRGKRLWEGIARIIDPIFILIEKRVEDLGLARGMGIGISQWVEAQDGIRQEIVEAKNLDAKEVSFKQDHNLNITAMKKLAKELWQGGLGKNRRFLTGTTMGNTSKSLSNFAKDFSFSSIKTIFDPNIKGRVKIKKFFEDSGLMHIKNLCAGDTEKDKGHTTALSGYLMTIGSLIGYMDKASKGILYKIGGSMRSIGGGIGDLAMLGFPDFKHNLCTPFLLVNGALDIIQRFVPKTATNLIKTIGNLSMASYNIGCAIYLDRSHDKTDHEQKISRYDTDLELHVTQDSALAAAT